MRRTSTCPRGVINPNGPIRSEPVGYHHNWIQPVLPWIDEANVWRHIDDSVGVYDEPNQAVRKLRLTVLVCPSEAEGDQPASSYAGCHHDVEAPIDVDNHGLLFLNSKVSEIPDGAEHTLLFGEKVFKPGDLGWLSGTRATLLQYPRADQCRWACRPGRTGDCPGKSGTGGRGRAAGCRRADGCGRAGRSGSPGGDFRGLVRQLPSGGAVFAFGNGSVKLVSDEIDQSVLQQLAHREDGKLLDESQVPRGKRGSGQTRCRPEARRATTDRGPRERACRIIPTDTHSPRCYCWWRPPGCSRR